MTEVENQNLQEKSCKSYYEQLMANDYVQQALTAYNKTKEYHPILKSTLTTAEENAYKASTYTSEKAYNGYKTLYLDPINTACQYVNYGQEKAKNAVETGKNAAVVGGTYGIGAAVVLAQFSLAISAGGASKVLEQVDSAKQFGCNTIAAIKQAELSMEHRIMSAVHQAQRIAMVPVETLTENTNSLLDILDGVVEKAFGVKVNQENDATIKERVSCLASIVVQIITNKAQNHVLEPINVQINVLIENLSKSFLLMDMMRSKRQWVADKVDEMSASVSDFKHHVETEAAKYKVKPEEMLMRSIRSSSAQLGENLKSLKERGQIVFGDGNRIDVAVGYLESLEKNFKDAENVYRVRDEVVAEARQRIKELTNMAANILIIDADMWSFEEGDVHFEVLHFEAPSMDEQVMDARRRIDRGRA